MIFRHEFTVNSHACDHNGIVRPTPVMTYFQEAVNRQVETYGPRDMEMRAEGRTFLLSRISINFHAPLYAYEDLAAETWAADCSRGFSFYRYHRILRGDTPLCDATTVWAYIDIPTRRPLRTTEYHPNFTTAPLPEGAMPVRMSLPKTEEMAPVGKYTVRYADVDRNRHMNNTVYADMLCGFLDLDGRRLSHLSLNYYHEAPLGTHLTAYYAAAEDGAHLFRTLREDGQTNVEAVIRTVAL